MTPDERERLYALLGIPSVSALPAHAPDMVRAAEAVADEVRHAGGTVEVRTDTAHPLVVGEVPSSSGGAAPRVIIYGHYDVQPVGDLALWTSDPFVPEVRDGNLYARGASDDKGNLFMLLAAVRRLADDGALPVDVTVLVDGEEEVSGDSALDWVRDEAPTAAAAVIFDIAMAGPGRPIICSGLRGLVYFRIEVCTGDGDAHSGMFGGSALNAAHALTQIIDALRPHNGRLHPDLYADVADVSPDEIAAWHELPAGQTVLEEAGLVPADAEGARAYYRRTLAEPSLDVHGIACGEPEAVKTNLPSRATATFSLRLAPGQRPERMETALRRIIGNAAPTGAQVTVELLSQADPALLDPRTPALSIAREAISRATGWPCAPVRVGGTIPVVAAFAARGIPTVLSGFGLPDDAIHAPDEHLCVEHLEIGTRAAMEILIAMGDMTR